MSVDLEDRLQGVLGDLARRAPVPDDWHDLGSPVFSLEARTGRRPRAVTVVVAAVAVVLIVAVTAFAVTRDPGPTTIRAASDPTGGAASSAPTFEWGHWDPAGPRLSDEQLSQVVTPSTDARGDTIWKMSRQVDGAGDLQLPFAARVTGMSMVEVRLGQVDLARFTGPDGKPLPQIQFYVGNDPPSPGRDLDQKVWLVAIEGTYTWTGPDCVDPETGASANTPHCEPFAGLSVVAVPADANDTRPTHFAFGPIAGMQFDFSRFDQVGRWTPT